MSPTEPVPRQHAFTGPAMPQLAEPSHAERIRTLMSLASVATLSTISRKPAGYPFRLAEAPSRSILSGSPSSSSAIWLCTPRI